MQENLTSDANRHDRGVRQAGFLVLNATSMPSILVELGYISNAEEAKYLASSSGQKKLSQCISRAFDKYYADLLKQSAEASAANISIAQENKEEDEVEEKQSQTVTNEEVPVFKVQFLSSSKKLDKGDSAFKELSPVEYYYDKGLYKYTYGATTNYNEILRTKRKVNEKFKDAFIVAFIKGERVDNQQAIALFKKNHP